MPYPKVKKYFGSIQIPALPTNIAPELIDTQSIKALQQTEKHLTSLINLELCVAYGALFVEIEEPKVIPLHLFTKFKYKSMTFFHQHFHL